MTQHAPDWTATPATPRESWTKSRNRPPSGPAASKQRPLPMEMHSRASQRSSRRPSSARIGRDRGMPKKLSSPCAARGASLQLKIGLPYQIYVNAPRAKFGGLGCRVWAAVGARLLKVGLSVLNPPLERGGNAVLDTGWYRMVPTVCGFECRRYT